VCVRRAAYSLQFAKRLNDDLHAALVSVAKVIHCIQWSVVSSLCYFEIKSKSNIYTAPLKTKFREAPRVSSWFAQRTECFRSVNRVKLDTETVAPQVVLWVGSVGLGLESELLANSEFQVPQYMVVRT